MCRYPFCIRIDDGQRRWSHCFQPCLQQFLYGLAEHLNVVLCYAEQAGIDQYMMQCLLRIASTAQIKIVLSRQ